MSTRLRPRIPNAPHLSDCPTCTGSGAVRAQLVRDVGRARTAAFVCPTCHGAGGWIAGRRPW